MSYVIIWQNTINRENYFCYLIFIFVFSNHCVYIYIYILLVTENRIKDFMKYFRENWPNASITPKLHMLEYHALPFIRKWGVGLGTYGEQGGESIHAEINRMKSTYCHMKGLRRLKSIMNEHFIKNNPTVKKYQKKAQPRKRKIVHTKNNPIKYCKMI